MSKNTICSDGGHHSMAVQAVNTKPDREQFIKVRCFVCGATATHWFYSEEQDWSLPKTPKKPKNKVKEECPHPYIQEYTECCIKCGKNVNGL